jgi:PAS domain S-box-containing protein
MDVPLSELESAALQFMPFGVIILDAQARIRLVNPRAAKLLGVQLRGTLGRRFMDTPAAPDLAYYSHIVKGIVNPDDYTNYRWVARMQGRSLHFIASVLKQNSSRKVGTVIVFDDVSHHLFATELFGALFHDITAPLATIQASSEFLLLAQDDLAGDVQREIVSVIHETAKRATELKQRYREELEKRQKDSLDE